MQTWILLLGILCTVIGTVTTWGFLTGKWTTIEMGRITQLEKDFLAWRTDVDRRFERAGQETSRAMSYMQGVEVRVLKECADSDLTNERFAQLRRDHDRLEGEIDNMKRLYGDRRAS